MLLTVRHWEKLPLPRDWLKQDSFEVEESCEDIEVRDERSEGGRDAADQLVSAAP